MDQYQSWGRLSNLSESSGLHRHLSIECSSLKTSGLCLSHCSLEDTSNHTVVLRPGRLGISFDPETGLARGCSSRHMTGSGVWLRRQP